MTNYMTLYMVNIAEAKAQLSDLLDRIAKGESVLICKRNQPIAELRPVAAARTTPRKLGHAKTLVEIPASFFEPLPDDEIDGFEGGFVYPPLRSHSANVEGTRNAQREEEQRRWILLDTCVFLWAITDAPQLSREARARIVDPANDVPERRLRLGNRREMAARTPEPDRSAGAFRPAHATRTASRRCRSTKSRRCVTRLPGCIAIRSTMLVSQAIVHGLTIFTPDQLVSQYPARTFW